MRGSSHKCQKYALYIGVCVGLATAAFDTVYAQVSLSDTQIRALIIEESMASYPGNCPCPENLTSNGQRCGKRSARSKPGGHQPICYPQEISDQMVDDYRKKLQ